MGNNTSIESSDTMKNTQSNDINDSYISPGESDLISMIFHNLKQANNSNSDSNLFWSKNCRIISENVKKLGILNDLNSFKSFFVNLCRKSNSNTVSTVWDIVTVKNSEKHSDDSLKLFLILLYDISHNNSFELAQYAHSLDKLLLFVTTFISRQRHIPVNYLENVTSDEIISWSNDFAPYVPRIFETYIQVFCFGNDNLSPGFTPFYQPILKDKQSTIVKNVDLFALALYSDKFQGEWRRLYTTEVDGLSFNRIVYHIFGYEVS